MLPIARYFYILLAITIASFAAHAGRGWSCRDELLAANISPEIVASTHVAVDESIETLIAWQGVTHKAAVSELAQPIAQHFSRSLVASLGTEGAGAFLTEFATYPPEIRASLINETIRVTKRNASKHDALFEFQFVEGVDFAVLQKRLRATPPELLYYQSMFMRMGTSSVYECMRRMVLGGSNGRLKPGADPRVDAEFARAAMFVINRFKEGYETATRLSMRSIASQYYVIPDFEVGGRSFGDGTAFGNSNLPDSLFHIEHALEALAFYQSPHASALDGEINAFLRAFADEINFDPARLTVMVGASRQSIIIDPHHAMLQLYAEVALLQRGEITDRSIDFAANVMRNAVHHNMADFFYLVELSRLNYFRPLSSFPGGERIAAAVRTFITTSDRGQGALDAYERFFRDYQTGPRSLPFWLWVRTAALRETAGARFPELTLIYDSGVRDQGTLAPAPASPADEPVPATKP